jgi:hypothetical protein
MPYKELFNFLDQKGCELQLILSIGVDYNTAHEFGSSLLQKISDLHLNLWFDLYPHDK